MFLEAEKPVFGCVMSALPLLLCACVAWGAIPADEITSLPGWDLPLPSKQYSGAASTLADVCFVFLFISFPAFPGYLPVPDGYLHYWFVLSQNNPATVGFALNFDGFEWCLKKNRLFLQDPVLLWLNGGPGSSSLIGLLTENGPLQTSDLSRINMTDDIPNLIYNKYNWALNYSVLWLEQPKVLSLLNLIASISSAFL
jgi:hypothetical protein